MDDGAEVYGGADMLRAAAATPLTPEIARTTSHLSSVTREDDGEAHTIANLCAIDKAKLARLVDKTLESHAKVEALERRVAAAERALDIERKLRGDAERDRDEALERARVLGEQLAASRDKVVAATATARKFQNKLRESRRVGVVDVSSKVALMEDEFEAPMPRQGLAMTPTQTRRRAAQDLASNDDSRGEGDDASVSAEFGIELAHLVESVERVSVATGRRFDSP